MQRRTCRAHQYCSSPSLLCSQKRPRLLWACRRPHATLIRVQNFQWPSAVLTRSLALKKKENSKEANPYMSFFACKSRLLRGPTVGAFFEPDEPQGQDAVRPAGRPAGTRTCESAIGDRVERSHRVKWSTSFFAQFALPDPRFVFVAYSRTRTSAAVSRTRPVLPLASPTHPAKASAPR